MDAKTIIGRFVRKLREQKELTQEQLASKTGITYQYLSGLENGRENFSIDILDEDSERFSAPMNLFVPTEVRDNAKVDAKEGACNRLDRSLQPE